MRDADDQRVAARDGAGGAIRRLWLFQDEVARGLSSLAARRRRLRLRLRG
jgi:hypothetical protein